MGFKDCPAVCKSPCEGVCVCVLELTVRVCICGGEGCVGVKWH